MPLCTLMRRIDCWFISLFFLGRMESWYYYLSSREARKFQPTKAVDSATVWISSYCYNCPWYGSSMSVFGTALASVLSLEMSLAPSMCWSYNPQDFFLWPAIHSIVLKSSRREQQGRRRDCGFFCYRLVLLIYPLHVFKLFSPSNAPNNRTPAAGAPRLAYLWQGPAPDGWPFGC